MALVPPEKLAHALNLSTRRIHQLVKAGMPKADRGQYDLGHCMFWYIRYLQEALGKKESMDEEGETTSIKAERTRLLKLQADAVELDLARKRGEVMALTDHERVVVDLVVTTRARIMAIPARAAPRVIGQTDRVGVEKVIMDEVREALAHLSKTVPRMPPREDEPHAAASEKAPKPAKKRAPPRK